ncbi:MAG TPA: hypothetical protein IAA41_04230, partial [Candidatus Eubacterium faecavium]|nr:hypothetical protein [Candidatus Eubacterium faecavium]
DDKIKFFSNYKKSTKIITFDELNNCSDLSDSPRPRRRGLHIVRGGFFICENSHLSLTPSLLLSAKRHARAALRFVGLFLLPAAV